MIFFFISALFFSNNSHAELGAASPYFVAPGAQWTDAEIKTQAELLAGYKYLNVGAICASPQVKISFSQPSF